MATKRKYYMTLRFETEEDWKKHFQTIYMAGKEDGYREGRVNALSYIWGSIERNFDSEELSDAQHDCNYRNIRKWQRMHEVLEKRSKESGKETEED